MSQMCDLFKGSAWEIRSYIEISGHLKTWPLFLGLYFLNITALWLNHRSISWVIEELEQSCICKERNLKKKINKHFRFHRSTLFSSNYVLVTTWRTCYQWLKTSAWFPWQSVEYEMEMKGKLPNEKLLTPDCSSLIPSRLEEIQWKWWASLGLGTSNLASSLDCWSNNLCAAATVWLIHGGIGVRYTIGEQGNQIERCFLFRKDELLDAECFFLRSVGLLSMFHQARFSSGQVGGGFSFQLFFCGMTFWAHCCLFLMISSVFL